MFLERYYHNELPGRFKRLITDIKIKYFNIMVNIILPHLHINEISVNVSYPKLAEIGLVTEY